MCELVAANATTNAPMALTGIVMMASGIILLAIGVYELLGCIFEKPSSTSRRR